METVDVFPRTKSAFKKWREERVFASEEQARRAVQVEHSMHIDQIDEAGTPVPNTRAMHQKIIDDFAQELRDMKNRVLVKWNDQPAMIDPQEVYP